MQGPFPRSLPEWAHSKSTPQPPAPPAPGLGSTRQFLEGQQEKLGLGKVSRQPRMQMLRRHSTSALCEGRAGTQEWDFLKHCTQGTLLASSSLVLALEERHSSTQRPHKALYPNNPNHKTETAASSGKVISPFSMEGVS